MQKLVQNFKEKVQDMTKKRIFVYVILLVLIIFSAVVLSKKPSHDRDWELGQEKLPKIEIDDNLITVKNLRDFDWQKEGTEVNYIEKTFDLNKLDGVDVVISHFSDFEGMAHIFLTFRFEDNENIAISVETRREDFEEFEPIKGLFRKFEIIYVVATEEDLIGVRTNVREDGRGERVYLYPTIATPEKSQELFKLLAEDINNVYDNPTFYNTLFNSCINTITRRVEEISILEFPITYKTILPGFFDEVLYEIGVFPKNNLTFEEFKKKNVIDNSQVDNHSDNFGEQIRSHFNDLKENN